MPHMFINRRRHFALLEDVEHPKAHLQWERVSAGLYIIGGILLTIGSVFFLPKYEEYVDTGTWMFLVASLLYLIVSTHDILEVLKAPRAEDTKDLILDLTAGISYSVGAILFIVGSVFFLPNTYNDRGGAVCFIAGCVLFLLGAFVNVLQIWSSPDFVSTQYANLIAACYVMGSTFYLSASIPYLYTFEVVDDARTVFKLIGELYTVGSALFLIGGLLDMRRFHWINKKMGPYVKEQVHDGLLVVGPDGTEGTADPEI
jgi:hypothetical protein